MPSNTDPNVKSGKGALWRCMLVLLLVLGAIFWRSFIPSQIMFANDGPLGPLNSQGKWFLATFTGTWQDLNWVGGQTTGSLPNFSSLIYLLFGPVGMLKINAGFSLFLLGLGAWFFLRRLGLGSAACLLGGLAAALNSNAVSNACWGLPAWCYTRGLAYFALGLLVTRPGNPWLRAVLAGGALGLGVADGFDTGAIFSLYVAAFGVYESLIASEARGKQLAYGIAKVAIVAVAAVLVAAQVLSTLIGTQIKGVQGTQQTQESKEQRWDFATQWSLPKVETLRVIIPGLFGYRMDTPDGGGYWGTVGQQPGWDVHHQGIPRYSGSGEYAGVLVMLGAALALVQSLRKSGSPFNLREKKLIWFWVAMAVVSLLLAFGRHAPFYHLVYGLPYFSTIRNPIKFMQPFHMAVVVLFGYGLEAVTRLYLSQTTNPMTALRDQLNAWWRKAAGSEKKWFYGLGAWVAASLLGLLIFSASKPDVIKFLQLTGFPETAWEATFRFSVGEIGWYLFFLVSSSVVLVLIAAGAMSGQRVRLAWLLLGVLLVADLARANNPWVQYYDYTYKYASNPVIEKLKQTGNEQRVKILPFQVNEALTVMQQVYQIEWLQHLFPYNNIQSLDITQEPRVAEDNAAYRAAFQAGGATSLLRLWELTNTRYLIGLSGEFINVINQQLDPVNKRFRPYMTFDLAPKPSASRQPKTEDFTAVAKPEGVFAVIEFTGALPRAALFANWQTTTNDDAALKTLADPGFDPHRTVLVSSPLSSPPLTAANASTNTPVEFKSYAPKHIQLSAKAEAPSVLLLNDKYDPNWKVWVDGQPQPLLRCNYLMRGVQVPAGTHTIDFRFEPPAGGLYVSLAAIGACLLLGVALGFIENRHS
jgi:hypothetical protein